MTKQQQVDAGAESWAARADAHALGEGPMPGPASDGSCQREVELFDALGAMGRPVFAEHDAALADDILERFAASTSAAPPSATPGARPRSRLRQGSIVALTVAATAAVLLALWARPNTADTPDTPDTTSDWSAEPMGSGEVKTSGAPPSLAQPPPPAPPGGTLDGAPMDFPEPSEPLQDPPLELAEAASASKAPRSPRPSEVEARLSAAELLARARAKKGEGDLRGAERSYRELLRAYPKSPEAHASQISLGQLQLRLGKAKPALQLFDAYARSGGALLEEAHWGKIQALDALGRGAARDAAIDAMVARFPSSAYTAKAKEMQTNTQGGEQP